MKNHKSIAGLVALAFVFTLMTAVRSSAQGVTNAHRVPVPMGQKLKVQGVVAIRNKDSFTVRDVAGAETTVLLTSQTDVTSHGFSKRDYPVTYIMRGLRLQAQGKGDADGNLVADWVRFDQQDLRAAQALEQTDELAKENEARIAAAEQAAREAAENARKMSQQIAENMALANDARARADAAQAQADAAYKTAAMANNRINGLDDYDTIRAFSILFAPNSAVLNAAARHLIDQGAAWAAAEKARGNTNGWLVQIVGFADTTGNTARNRSLSSRRANAVIDYLVIKYDLDLRRLVQPFGYGESKPVASNATAAGRAKNRRVEVRVLQNKGIANTVNP